MLKSTVFLILLTITLSAAAQEVSFYGFVKAESIHDTRQVAQVREGQFHLFPLAPEDLNGDGTDDYATDNFLLAAFQSRIGAKGVTRDLAKGVLTGTIEADFFGSSNADVSMLRLRHAFARWNRNGNELLFGQYWSPMFTTSVFPQVVGFATGAPFQPFARFPQVRYTRTQGSLKVLVAASSQRDAFQEIGGRKMQHQSGLPAGHLHISTTVGDALFGIGVTSKKIVCDLGGPSFIASAATAYSTWNTGPMTFRVKGVLGEDLADHLMTGGFVATTDGQVSPTRVASYWVDVSHSRKSLEVGFFSGYLVNLGTEKTLDQPVESTWTRADTIDQMWRLAPRVSVRTQNLRIALEIEATSVRYGSSFDSHYAPIFDTGDETITNVRTLLAVYYSF